MQPPFKLRLFIGAFFATLVLSGCQTWNHREQKAPEPPPAPVIQSPVATHAFTISPEDDVIGELQVTTVQGEDTLPDIARRFNLGYEEMVRANPGIDPWLPGAGKQVVLPTQFVLPKAPREGLVINLAELRVYYFPKVAEDEAQRVITHPIGIGKVGWSTPEGTTKVTAKRKNPTWFPPSSVRKEHREAGDPLPAKVPPGPDNPLGAHMMTLGWPSYLIHGTNKPYGVGLRSSHGCIRLYPEDIAELFDDIPVGTKVTVVNQPFVFGWHDGTLYAQIFPKLEDDDREHPQAANQLLNVAISDDMRERVKEHNATVDVDVVNSLVTDRRGIALPVTHGKLSLDEFVASARHVENTLPAGATWNGSQETFFTAEEFEAAKTGAILPKKPAPTAKQNKKTHSASKTSVGPAATGSAQ
jgi:L,D-transpeptidase ErfK/SrfK